MPRRLEIIERATRTRALPEMAGAACWRAPGGTNLVFGRGWREGRYLRSHEQVWVAIDLSTARSLTTAEIREGLAAAEALERRLGAGHYVRWLIAGDGMPSPEALDLMRRQRLICSCREQITLLARMLAPVEGRRDFPAPPDESASAAPSFSLHLPDPDPPAAEVHGIHRLNLPARAESEFVAAQAAERIARDAGFAPTDVGRIKTAVLEGMLNAIEHSSNPEKQVVLRFALTPQALEIVIENEGRNFDPLAVPEPVAREKVAAPSKRGWGISLMRRFMDEVAYEPAPGLTRLRLVKRRLGEPEPRESRELSGAAASARPGASNHPGSRFGEAPS